MSAKVAFIGYFRLLHEGSFLFIPVQLTADIRRSSVVSGRLILVGHLLFVVSCCQAIAPARSSWVSTAMRCSRLKPVKAASRARTSTGPSAMPCLASIAEVDAGTVLRRGFPIGAAAA